PPPLFLFLPRAGRPSSPPPFPYTTLFRSISHVRQNRVLGSTMSFAAADYADRAVIAEELAYARQICTRHNWPMIDVSRRSIEETDRKSTRLNSSHVKISYAVFCLKKKT